MSVHDGHHGGAALVGRYGIRHEHVQRSPALHRVVNGLLEGAVERSLSGDVDDVGEDAFAREGVAGGYRLRRHRAARHEMQRVLARRVAGRAASVEQPVRAVENLLAHPLARRRVFWDAHQPLIHALGREAQIRRAAAQPNLLQRREHYPLQFLPETGLVEVYLRHLRADGRGDERLVSAAFGR